MAEKSTTRPSGIVLILQLVNTLALIAGVVIFALILVEIKGVHEQILRMNGSSFYWNVQVELPTVFTNWLGYVGSTNVPFKVRNVN